MSTRSSKSKSESTTTSHVVAVLAGLCTVGGCVVAWIAVERHGREMARYVAHQRSHQTFVSAVPIRTEALARVVAGDASAEPDYNAISAAMVEAHRSVSLAFERAGSERSLVMLAPLERLEATALSLASLRNRAEAMDIVDGRARSIALAQLVREVDAASLIIEQWYRTTVRRQRVLAHNALLATMASLLLSGIAWTTAARIGRRRNRELRDARDHATMLGAVASRTAEAVAILDDDGRIEWANDGWRRTLQQDPKATGVGEPLFRLMAGLGSPVATIDAIREGIEHGTGCRLETGLVAPGGDRSWVRVEVALVNDPFRGRRFVAMMVDLTDYRRATERLHRTQTEIERIFRAVPGLVVTLDDDDRVLTLSGSIERHAGRRERDAAAAAPGPATLAELGCGWDLDTLHEGMNRVREHGGEWRGEAIRGRLADGEEIVLDIRASRLTDEEKEPVGVLLVVHDITDRAQMSEQLERSRRLESIGQLAAGVAHEINTPTQFVKDNLAFIDESLPLLANVVERAEAVVAEAGEEQVSALRSAIEAADLDFLREEIPASIEQSRDGMERIAQIVSSMKAFSHPGESRLRTTSINEIVESSCQVCRNEWKHVAELDLQLDDQAGEADCVPGELGQVILNLVVNAAHAVSERLKRDAESGGEGAPANLRGSIGVATRDAGDTVEILVRDDGTGMDEGTRRHIFDPFFTTKGVGKGTGQGLALVHGIVVDRYHGQIDVQSAPGHGTMFRVILPRHARVQQVREAA